MADADPSTSTSNAATPENVTGGTPLGLDEIKGYLRQKDDTSRFVGLALLKSALDTQPSVRQDEVVLNSLWESISPTFLARLLRAANKYNEQENAKEMVDIAVSVLHIFAILLPAEKREDTKFVSRIDGLLSCLEQWYKRRVSLVYK